MRISYTSLSKRHVAPTAQARAYSVLILVFGSLTVFYWGGGLGGGAGGGEVIFLSTQLWKPLLSTRSLLPRKSRGDNRTLETPTSTFFCVLLPSTSYVVLLKLGVYVAWSQGFPSFYKYK